MNTPAATQLIFKQARILFLAQIYDCAEKEEKRGMYYVPIPRVNSQFHFFY